MAIGQDAGHVLARLDREAGAHRAAWEDGGGLAGVVHAYIVQVLQAGEGVIYQPRHSYPRSPLLGLDKIHHSKLELDSRREFYSFCQPCPQISFPLKNWGLPPQGGSMH